MLSETELRKLWEGLNKAVDQGANDRAVQLASQMTKRFPGHVQELLLELETYMLMKAVRAFLTMVLGETFRDDGDRNLVEGVMETIKEGDNDADSQATETAETGTLPSTASDLGSSDQQ